MSENSIKQKNPAIFLSLSLRFANEYLDQLCDLRQKYSNDEIQESKKLTILHRALWTALIVEVRKLFGKSFKEYENYSLKEISFFNTDPHKAIIDQVYGDQVIQKILTTSNNFTIHLGKEKTKIFSVSEICESDLKNLLMKLQMPIDKFKVHCENEN